MLLSPVTSKRRQRCRPKTFSSSCMRTIIRTGAWEMECSPWRSPNGAGQIARAAHQPAEATPAGVCGQSHRNSSFEGVELAAWPPPGRIGHPSVDLGFLPSRAVDADLDLRWERAL